MVMTRQFETIISINGERMSWSYPDITFAQIQYLATGQWRDITPTVSISYINDSGDLTDIGVLKPGQILDIRRRQHLTLHVAKR
jgi:hypothetical protein